MLKTKVSRPGEFTDMPLSVAKKASRKHCAICGSRYGKMLFDRRHFEVWKPVQHIHHLLPRRFLQEQGIYPHLPQGLLSICQQCHGKAKLPEDRLFQGDLLGFLQGLKWANFPVDRIVAFAASVGLTEFTKLKP